MGLEHKSVPFAIKAVDTKETGWEIAGLASTFWGEPDAYGDVIQPGAFAASLASRATKFLYEHHTPIGSQLELRETDEGLYGRWTVVDTTVGTDAYKLAKAGVLDSLSIGYIPLEWTYRDDGVRVLQKVDLLEVSAVAIPANVNAVITDVKRQPIPDPDPDPEPVPAPTSLAELLDLASIRARLVAAGVDIPQE